MCVEAHSVDLVVINAENAAGGFGVTPQIAEDLFDLGADVLTTGNHVWDKRELVDYMKSVPEGSQERPRRVLRPANLQAGLPGYGVFEGMTREWRVLRGDTTDGPRLHERNQRPLPRCQCSAGRVKAKVILVDFHAEATSEKVAIGWHLDGRVTAVLRLTHGSTAATLLHTRHPRQRPHEQPSQQRRPA